LDNRALVLGNIVTALIASYVTTLLVRAGQRPARLAAAA